MSSGSHPFDTSPTLYNRESQDALWKFVVREWKSGGEREREKKKHLIIWIGPAGVGGRASSKLELHTEKRRKTTASDPNQRTTRFVGWWSPYCLITLDEGHSLSSPRPPYGRWQTSQYVVYVDLFFFFLFLFLSCNTPTHLFCLSPPSFFVTSARINEKKKRNCSLFFLEWKSSQFATSMCGTINKNPTQDYYNFFFRRWWQKFSPKSILRCIVDSSRVTFIPSSTLTIEYCSVTLIWFSLSSVGEMTCSPVFIDHDNRGEHDVDTHNASAENTPATTTTYRSLLARLIYHEWKGWRI